MCFGTSVDKSQLARVKPLRPIGTQFLSGPPVGSLEFAMMPVGIRRLWLLSVTQEAAGYSTTKKDLKNTLQKRTAVRHAT